MQSKVIIFIALLALAVLPIEMAVTYKEWTKACSSRKASADWIKSCNGEENKDECLYYKRMWIKACPDKEDLPADMAVTYKEWKKACNSKRASADWIKSCNGEEHKQRCVTAKEMWVNACPDREAKRDCPWC